MQQLQTFGLVCFVKFVWFLPMKIAIVLTKIECRKFHGKQELAENRESELHNGQFCQEDNRCYFDGAKVQ